MVILTDTREQRPYTFQAPTETGTLAVGDYSIKGLEHCVSIERKSLDDLIACLSSGRDRFERELWKSRAMDYFALVVESSLADIAAGKYRSRMNAKSAIQSLLAFSVRYRLPVFFAESRKYGQRITESLLLRYVREIEHRFERLQGERAD